MARAKKIEEELPQETTAEQLPQLTTADITPEDVRLIEAILFATPVPLSVGAMAERFPADRVILIPDVLDILQEQYKARGVNLVQRENKWAIRTATDLGDSLRLEKEQPKKFTRAAQETLAVIGYHQPVTRAEIENIRGVATSPGALDALMEAGWIKPGKRREVPGRPVTWLTTQSFLDHFGLERLEDLPGMEELKAAGLLDKRPAIEAMPSADLFDGDAAGPDIDPNEVTDEDLIGKSDLEEEMSDDEDDAENDDDFEEEDDDDFEDEDDEGSESEQEDKE
jgi:segregation and condensation protein B